MKSEFPGEGEGKASYATLAVVRGGGARLSGWSGKRSNKWVNDKERPLTLAVGLAENQRSRKGRSKRLAKVLYVGVDFL